MALIDFSAAVIAARTLIALVFLAAAIGKMRHWPIFQGVVANYRLLPERLVPPVAWILPPFEALLGVALLLGLGSPWPQMAAAALLLVFAAAMAINLRRGRRHIDCGCFQGALKQTLRWTLVVRNLVLVLLLGLPLAVDAGGSAWPSLVNGLLAGGVLFVLLQCLTLLWSIEPAWRRRHDHASGVVE